MPTATPPAVDDESEASLPAAAILDDGRCNVDTLLATVVQELRADGRQVQGLLMTYPDGNESCAGRMVLVDILTGDGYQVSQDLGSGSSGCRADSQGFARATQVLRQALQSAPELVVCNRYGGLEAEAGGFSAEMLALMSQGLPLLTAVTPRHLDAWRHFSGGATVLPAEPDAVRAWLARTLPALG